MKLSNLILILLGKAALMVWLISTGMIGLGPDEAQYWTWSQELALGYYSKPPGIAWQIGLGTWLFGDTELGVRFPTVVLGTLLPLSVYALARSCRLRQETAFWAGLILALSPLGVFSSLFAITDVGMVFFWTLGCIVIARALAHGDRPNYYLFGLMIFFAALFKWPAYLLWIFPLLLMPLYPNLRSRHYVGGIFVSLLGLLPSVIWNAQNDWATFQHVFKTVNTGKEIAQGNFFDFIGMQAALLSPILFIILVIAFIAMLRDVRRMWPSLLFCGGAAFLLLSGYSLLALFKKMQGNWVDFAYPTAIVLLAWYACEQVGWGKRWLKIGTGFSVLMVGLVLTIPFLQYHSIVNIPYRLNAFRHNVGWSELTHELKEAGYDPEEHFLFGDKYQMSSILSFYGPGQNRAYFLNLHGARKNQFSYWPGMQEEQMGKTGYFVLAENMPYLERGNEERISHYSEVLQNYFSEVEYLGRKTLFQSGGRIQKAAYIYRCIGYNGNLPSETDLY